MSKLTPLCVILVSFAVSTMVEAAGPMTRIERNIKSLDLKLNAHTMDISTLKHDVVDANNKLDLILEILNGTTITHKASHGSNSDRTYNRDSSDQATTLNNLKITIRGELNRVRQAFVAEKRTLMEQQKQNNAQFHELVQRVNDTLANVKDRQDTNCTLAANVLNASVVSVLGSLRDDVRNQVSVMDQSIREHVNNNAKKTLSKLDTVDHSISTVNSSIHGSIKEVDKAVMASVHTSGAKYYDVTQKLQREMTSSLNDISETVQSIDCPQECVGVAAIQAQGLEIEDLLRQLSSKIGNDDVRVPYPTNPFSGHTGRRPPPPPGHSRGRKFRIKDPHEYEY